MNSRYLCPVCKSDLKIKNSLIFSAHTENGVHGLVLLSPELGNYEIIHSPEFIYSDGERVEFYCPVCHSDLSNREVNSNMVEVYMIDETGSSYKIIFSKIAGKKCTIKMKEECIVEFYGPDIEEFWNFWGSGPRY